ncbi:hypothetical protein JRC04_22990 [Mycolicibacterium sp. S2-37]|uniref:hypothetical protein n=1 Tax=Mycolicibacterium sp. S2-37 TaxID=2810297 RepID=UPI001A9535A8|nr:hypothetical protein [Mycolicibacterium sp. S2-37]MBO0680342.1 hypothetical protein [Mycolicibacterium sp. S2-37]
MNTRVYELYPTAGGGFSAKTADYRGAVFVVAATSVRQAYAVAHKAVWINPDHTHPVGIISILGTGTTLWCGCSGHHISGGSVRHGDGIRAIRTAIAAHQCDQPKE